MVVSVEKTEKGYMIPLTDELVERFGLTAGSRVDMQLQPVIDDAQNAETIGDEEALRLYEQSKKKFGAAYEALAK